MERTLSRRNFVAGAAGAAVAGAGAVAGLGSAVVRADEPEAEGWDYAADVVICGWGVAGAMGAREAALQGLSCIVVEAAPRELAGGASTCFGGYYVPSSAEGFMAGGLDEAGAYAVAEQAQADFAWMLANGLPVGDIMKVDGAGRGFYGTLAPAMEAVGTPVLWETRAVELVRDAASGEVVGVVAEQADGTRVRLAGRRGVLLATGGVAQNDGLMGDFFFPQIEVLNTSSPYNRGDGLEMGMRLGAKLHNMGRFGIELQNLALTKASRETGAALVCYPAGEAAGARIIVNGAGQRFMDEQLDLAHFKGLCPWLEFPGAPQLGGYQGYINLPMYLVFDAQLMGSEVLGEGLVDYGWAISKDVYRWSPDNAAELEAGWIASGDTIEELAANLAAQSGNDPVDAAALQATVDAWNAAVAAGEPDPFGRTAMLPLDQPPYYAAELSMTVMYTIGGLTAGADGRTLGADGQWIAGLWHAGDVGQPLCPGVMGACPAGATGALAVRDMAAAPARTIAGAVANEVEPVGEPGVSVARDGIGAGA